MLGYLDGNLEYFSVSTHLVTILNCQLFFVRMYFMVSTHLVAILLFFVRIIFSQSLTHGYNTCFQQVLLEMNLSKREMLLDRFVKSAMNSPFHSFDLSLLVLSKMLKVVIAFVHPDYIWMSMPDVNISEASIVLVFDGRFHIYATGD